MSKDNHEPKAKGETARDRPKEAGVQEVRGDELQTNSQGRGMLLAMAPWQQRPPVRSLW